MVRSLLGRIKSHGVAVFASAALVAAIAWAAANITATATVSTIAALRAIPAGAAATQYRAVEVLGYYATGDFGPAEIYVWSAASSSTDNGGTVINPTGNGGNGRYLLNWDGRINVKQFGAHCDATTATSGTDDFTPINAAITAVHAFGGGTVIFPAGKCRIITGSGGGRSLGVYSNIEYSGDANGVSTLFYDDQGIDWDAFAAVAAVSNVRWHDFACIGVWDTTLTNAGGDCVNLTVKTNYNIRFDHMETANISRTGFNCTGCNQIWVTDNYGHVHGGAGWNCGGCMNYHFDRNVAVHFADDDISVSVEPAETEPVGGVGTINNNSAYDTFGIQSLGGKVLAVNDNVGLRLKGWDIEVSYEGSFTEGETSSHTVSIKGNAFSDTLSVNPSGGTNAGECFLIGSFGQAGSHTLPWNNNSGAGTVQQPWPYAWTNGQLSVNTTVEPGHGLVMSGNSCGRSLSGVGTVYSAAGFNPTGETNGAKMITPTGWLDITLTEANMSVSGIVVRDYLNNAWIANNDLEPGLYCVLIEPVLTANSVQNSTFTHNRCSNTPSDGVGSNLAAPLQLNMTFVSNEFNCDPFFVSPNRTTHGKWSNAAAPSGLDLSYMKGAVEGGNQFKNCLQLVRINSDSIVSQIAEDVYWGTPAALGYSANNIGDGYVPPTGTVGKWHFVIADFDPTSATYGQVTNDNYEAAATIPTTGTWVQGEFVWNNSGPVCSGGVLSYGWSRRTTGASNTSGTDWFPTTLGC